MHNNIHKLVHGYIVEQIFFRELAQTVIESENSYGQPSANKSMEHGGRVLSNTKSLKQGS